MTNFLLFQPGNRLRVPPQYDMSRFLLFSFFLNFVSLAAFGQAAANQTHVLGYAQPARSWLTEAMPLVNGSLGGMFFGLTSTERIQFNANIFWTGNEKDTGKYQAFGDVFIQLNYANPTGCRRELDLARAVQRVSDLGDTRTLTLRLSPSGGYVATLSLKP